MKFHPVQKQAKDNTTVILREATSLDAGELRRVVKEYVEESEFIPYSENEYQLTLEDEIKWIESFHEVPNSLLILALVDRKIVGNITLTGNKRQQLQHTAIVGLGMLKSFRGKGLGRILFEAAIGWARDHSSLESLTLEVNEANHVGRKLYESLGFAEVGRLPRNVKFSTTYYTDTIIMTMKTNINN
ncbi:MAG: hypothetical protein BGN96_03025 [Bacteroidales bacterium 45-6]|nr:MAG: hypothetical protein BGN96_03025 [Bacteroidales bacterium 45-6]